MKTEKFIWLAAAAAIAPTLIVGILILIERKRSDSHRSPATETPKSSRPSEIKQMREPAGPPTAVSVAWH